MIDEVEYYLDALERTLRGFKSISVLIKKIDPETTLSKLVLFRKELKKFDEYITKKSNDEEDEENEEINLMPPTR